MRLITNNPTKIDFINSIGIEITERIPAITALNEFNKDYVQVKKEQMGHML